MGLRQRGSVIGNYATASNISASGIWTGKEAYTLQKKGTWQIPPTFSVSASASSVNEGSSVTFTLSTTGVANGVLIPYTLSGANITIVDSGTNSLSGNFVIQNGTGTVSISPSLDISTEGNEVLQINVVGLTANVTINDISVSPDPQFSYTTLLLNGDGTNNSQNNTFLDSATIPSTVTRNGNPTQGTFTPYGANWSTFIGYGAYGYQSLPANAGYDIGGADFTIEFWANFRTWNTMGSSGMVVLGNFISTNGWYVNWNGGVGGNFSFSTYSSGANGPSIVSTGIMAGTDFQLGTWNHFTIMQKTNVIYFYLNGVMKYSAAAIAYPGTGQSMYIGVYAQNFSYAGNPYFYYSNLRIVKGTGIYSITGFTPPTTPLTAIAGTTLLIGQSSSLVDKSTINATITNTVSGAAPSSQRFSPFSPSSVYSATVHGGSAYFDGTGDYLVTSASSALALATNASNFTMECWVYNNGGAGSQYGRGICIYYPSGEYATNRLMFRLVSGENRINVYLLANSSAEFGGAGTDGTAIATINAWTHVALVRNAGVFYVYVNGVLDITVNSSSAASSIPFTTFNTIEVGRTQDGSSPDWFGYISNYRFVKGTAVYTGNFTPPTAPLLPSGTSSIYPNTANVNTTFSAANTALLCNFTNAGIIDNAMMLNLETVGDSKISTTQSKFGGSSMSFDGTGDFLVSPSNSVLVFGTGDFTVECWVYTPAIAEKGILQTSDTAGGFKTSYTTGIVMAINSSGYWRFLIGSGNLDTTVAPVINTWTHLAVTRASGQVKTFINGTVATTATVTDNLTGNYIGIGSYYNTTYGWNGYIDDLRITNGYARYTTNFTPTTNSFSGQ